MSGALALGLAGSAVLILVGAVTTLAGLGDEERPGTRRLAVGWFGALMIFAGAGNAWLSIWQAVRP